MRRWIVLGACLLFGLATPAQEDVAVVTPVTDAMLQNPDPSDWLMWRRTLNRWGYSPLNQIARDNVEALGLVWSSPLGAGVQDGTPLVYDGVMYMPNPRDVVQAIDAATGDLRWEYRRRYADDLEPFFDTMPLALLDINRNLAIYGGLIINTSADGYVFALHAVSDELAWET